MKNPTVLEQENYEEKNIFLTSDFRVIIKFKKKPLNKYQRSSLTTRFETYLEAKSFYTKLVTKEEQKPMFILNNSLLLTKSKCKILNKILYEKCKFKKNDETFHFANNEQETYYLNKDMHVYRMFFDSNDYDYVTDRKTLIKLNKLFK
jgi:hypothetical protein